MKKFITLGALVALAGCTTPAYIPDQYQDADAPMTHSYWSRKSDDTRDVLRDVTDYIYYGAKGIFTNTYWSDRGNDILDIFTFTAGVGVGATARVSALHVGLGIYDDVVGLRGGNFFAQDHNNATGTSEFTFWGSDQFFLARLESKNIRMAPTYMMWWWDLMTTNQVKDMPNTSYWIPMINVPTESKFVVTPQGEILYMPVYIRKPGVDPYMIEVGRELNVGFTEKSERLKGMYMMNHEGFNTLEGKRWAERYHVPSTLPEPAINPYYFQVEASASFLPGFRVGVNPGELMDCIGGFFYIDMFADDYNTYERWEKRIQRESLDAEDAVDYDDIIERTEQEGITAKAKRLQKEMKEEERLNKISDQLENVEVKDEPGLSPHQLVEKEEEIEEADETKVEDAEEILIEEEHIEDEPAEESIEDDFEF